MIDQKLINRINELAKIAKERELTINELKNATFGQRFYLFCALLIQHI